MQWWNDILDWFGTRDGQAVLFGAIIPFIAILVAGVVAAGIGRGSTKRLITLNDRENRVAAVATMIGGARRASVWNTLSAPEQQHADHVASEADVRLRLLAVQGSGLAADWAAHEISAMKRNSVSFSFQAEQSLIEFRDRMVEWQARPTRAKKLFKNDLDLWAYEDSQTTKDIISQQQAWAASQVASETGQVSTLESDEAGRGPNAAAEADATPPSSAPVAPTRPRAARSISDLVTDDSDQSRDGTAPELVEPTSTTPRRPGDDTPDEDSLDGDRHLDDVVYSPPVNANAVTKRIKPPTVGDDGRKY